MQAGNEILTVTSTTFEAQHSIPKKCSYDGGNVMPQLSWSKGPDGTQCYVIICDDPDAPTPQPWVHLVLYNIPANTTKLPEGKIIGKQGGNDYKEVGWGGPKPPSGTHRYYFTVYALNGTLNFSSHPTKKEIMQAMKGKILAQGTLMGTFSAAT